MPPGSILWSIPAPLHAPKCLKSANNIPDFSSWKKEPQLAGLVPFSTVDFPGALAAVLFFQGCPWECRYCHNPHLRTFHSRGETPEWTWEKAAAFLQERAGFLDGVVFSGGEPTVQPFLPQAINEARALGYRIGLHTAGAYPNQLSAILPLVDWVGLDIKAPLDARYELITGVQGSAAPVLASLSAILSLGISYQLRTTVHPLLHSQKDLEDLHRQLEELGAEATIIQKFRTQGCLDTELVGSAA